MLHIFPRDYPKKGENTNSKANIKHVLNWLKHKGKDEVKENIRETNNEIKVRLKIPL